MSSSLSVLQRCGVNHLKKTVEGEEKKARAKKRFTDVLVWSVVGFVL